MVWLWLFTVIVRANGFPPRVIFKCDNTSPGSKADFLYCRFRVSWSYSCFFPFSAPVGGLLRFRRECTQALRMLLLGGCVFLYLWLYMTLHNLSAFHGLYRTVLLLLWKAILRIAGILQLIGLAKGASVCTAKLRQPEKLVLYFLALFAVSSVLLMFPLLLVRSESSRKVQKSIANNDVRSVQHCWGCK